MKKVISLLGYVLMVYSSAAYSNERQALQFISYCEYEINVTKNYEQAGKVCRRVSQNVKNILGPSQLYLRSIINEAELEWIQGKYPDAFYLYTEAADVAEVLNDQAQLKKLRVRQADAEMFRGKSVDAEILMRDALRRQQASVPKDVLQEADLLSKHADILVALGQPRAAMQGYLSAFEKLDLERIDHRPVLLRTQLHYAELFERQSRYVGAMASYHRLSDTASAMPESIEYMAIALRRMGWISGSLGNTGDARGFYQQFLKLVENDSSKVAEVVEIRMLLSKLDSDEVKISQPKPSAPN